MTELEQLPNIGPAVARRLRSLGIEDRADLEAVGPVEVYRRLRRRRRGAPPSLRHYLFGLEAALLGLSVRDLPAHRRIALVRAALDLPDSGPVTTVRPRHVIRARRR
jgi:hypothetical protein